MSRLTTLGAILALSLALSLYLTPLVRNAALRFGVLDRPDGGLKQHRAPTPYMGGVAVYLAFLVTLSVVFDFNPQLLGLLLGGTMMVMLGLFDDMRVISPWLKLGGQCLATWVMFKSGIYIKLVALPEWLAWPLSALWLIGVTNALNIIDVSDGLATGVAAIAAWALATVAVANHNDLIAAPTLALCGSLLGFLYYNRAPARIYLGDAGSLFIGFMLAALSMIDTYSTGSMLPTLAPLLILVVPLFDTVLVSLARLRQRRSPLLGSADHFALRLKHRGWSSERVAIFGWLMGACGAAAAFLLVWIEIDTARWVVLSSGGALSAVFVWMWRLPVPPRAAVVPLPTAPDTAVAPQNR